MSETDSGTVTDSVRRSVRLSGRGNADERETGETGRTQTVADGSKSGSERGTVIAVIGQGSRIVTVTMWCGVTAQTVPGTATAAAAEGQMS